MNLTWLTWLTAFNQVNQPGQIYQVNQANRACLIDLIDGLESLRSLGIHWGGRGGQVLKDIVWGYSELAELKVAIVPYLGLALDIWDSSTFVAYLTY